MAGLNTLTKAKKVVKVAETSSGALPSAAAAASSSTSSSAAASAGPSTTSIPQAASAAASSALMDAKPKRAARKAKAGPVVAKMSTSEREWARKEAHSLQDFLWSLTIAQLKSMMKVHGIENGGSIKDKDSAVAMLFAHLHVATEEEEADADPEEPGEDVSTDTSAEPDEGDVVNVVGAVLGINGGGGKGSGKKANKAAGVWSDSEASTPAPSSYKIDVKILATNKTITMTVKASDTIDDVKAKIQVWKASRRTSSSLSARSRANGTSLTTA